MRVICLFVVLMAMCVVMTSSKGMWGSRRKREKKEVVQDKVTKPKANRRERYTPPVKPSITNVPDVDGNGLEEVLDAYLKIVEDSLDSGEFAKIVTPETIMSFIEQVPGLSDNEELTTLMASPEMRNPRQLLQTVKEGVKMIRQYFKEIISTLNDPAKLAEMFEQLPPEFTAVLEGLKSGDTSVLQKFITDLPGLEDSQKDLFLGLLNGNSDALTSQIHSLLGSPDQVEAARQQFLESPDLAEAMGLPMDILADPAQFAALMAEGIEELSKLDGSSSGDDDGDNDGDDGVDGRESIRSLLGGSSRRARLGDSDEEEDEEVGEFDVDVSGEALRANQAQLDRLRKKLLGSMQRAA